MIKVIRKVEKKELENWIYTIEEEDPNLYKEANNPSKIGIFQISGQTAEKLCEEVKPESFSEIIAINAMARPGPLETCAPYYVERKESGESPYPKEVEDILEESHFTFLYQEQIMETFHKIGGFTLEEADNVRGLMKRLSKAEKAEEDLKAWNRAIKKFIRGASKLGIDEDMAIKISEDLEAFAGYSFNKCFFGGSIIDRDNRARWSPTIEEMWLTKNDKDWAIKNNHKDLYKKYNFYGYGKAYSIINDRAFLNEITNITYEGEREVFQIILDDNRYIQVTENHKFPLKNGNYKSIKTGLSEGDELFCIGSYKQETKYNFSNYSSKNRPFKKYSNEGFLNGEENSGYINGEYIKFVNNRNQLLEISSGECSVCYKKTKRLECHHKDGNRKNNERENLLICCSSCHKKLDYKLGRKRKNEKGLPLEGIKIRRIDKLEAKKTYNVEMASPNHTVSVNGIMASNSHATSYSYIALITLYFSYYFRNYFYSAVLSDDFSMGKVNSIKRQGIEILPPDINKSGIHFKPDGDGIRIGLNDIKFVGEPIAEKIVENAPYTSFIDLFMKNKGRSLTIKTLESLISVGAFDALYPERKKFLQAVKTFWEKKKSTKVEEKLRAIFDSSTKAVDAIPAMDTTMEDLIEYEKTFFGFKLFSTLFTKDRMEAFDKAVKAKLMYSNLDSVENKSKKIAVMINAIRKIQDRNGNEMAFVEIEDMHGTIVSVPIFASYWKP